MAAGGTGLPRIRAVDQPFPGASVESESVAVLSVDGTFFLGIGVNGVHRYRICNFRWFKGIRDRALGWPSRYVG